MDSDVGRYAHRYASGREGDAPAGCFAAREAASTVYVADGVGAHADLLEKLDPHTTGEGCIYMWKLDGLDEAALRPPMTPSGTSLLGMVKHLGAVRYAWFVATFGRDTKPLPFDEDAEDEPPP